MVERKPSKLDVAGSSPVSRSDVWWWYECNARVAQSVEHTLGKGEVTGSIPVASSEVMRERFVERESLLRGEQPVGGLATAPNPKEAATFSQ